MKQSDPNWHLLGPFGQYGQTEFYFEPENVITFPRYTPFGRLREAPPYMTIEAEWLFIQDNGEPLTPVEEQLALFHDVLLIRDPIREHIPSSPPWFIQTVDSPHPRFVYTSPHWMSNTMAGESTDINPDPFVLMDCRWFLFYSHNQFADEAMATCSFDALIDQTDMFHGYIETFDSWGVDANPSNINANSTQHSGWTLCLLKRRLEQEESDETTITVYDLVRPSTGQTISLTIQNPPINVVWHLYGAWQMKQPVTIQLDPPLPENEMFISNPGPRIWRGENAMFDPLRRSEWTIFHNPLNFPIHKMWLSPFRV